MSVQDSKFLLIQYVRWWISYWTISRDSPLKAYQPTIYIPISGHIIYVKSIINTSVKETYHKDYVTTMDELQYIKLFSRVLVVLKFSGFVLMNQCM